MNEPPKFSIITPTFNQGNTLERTIQSVLDQQYPNIEYIIIDGGSTDITVDILKKYDKNLHYWISEKVDGQSAALNKGFGKCSGDIIAWINSDDWYEQNTFATVAQKFLSGSHKVIHGNCNILFEGRPQKNFVDKPGAVSLQRLLRYWKPYFCPPQPALFFSKSLLNEVGLLDESLIFGMDVDLFIRFAKVSDFTYIDQTFASFLIHSQSKSGSGKGLVKFIPEWKRVVLKNLKSLSLLDKILFYKDYYSRRSVLKSIIKRVLINTTTIIVLLNNSSLH